MVKKIRSFVEYDATRTEFEKEMPAAVEQGLEILVANALKNEQKSPTLAIVVSSPLDFLTALAGGPDELLRVYMEKRAEKLRPSVERIMRKKMFTDNMHNLLTCSVAISQQEAGVLGEDSRLKLYVRFLDEVKALVENPLFRSIPFEYPVFHDVVKGFHPPEREEDKKNLKQVLEVLRRQNYITEQNSKTMLNLLYPAFVPQQQSTTKTAPALSSSSSSSSSSLEKSTISPENSRRGIQEDSSTLQERTEFLEIIFRLPKELATHYASQTTLGGLDTLHHELTDLVGEETALRLVRENPNLLTYPADNLFTKYCTTLRVVQEKIKQHGHRAKIQRRFGISTNLGRYANLESLLKLKRDIFAMTGEHEVSAAVTQSAFDLEAYKDGLLDRAGLNKSIVRAFTEGKTSHYKGDDYIPQEYFRKNAIGKVDAQTFGTKFDETFETMVKKGAITKKGIRGNPLYCLNSHIDEIADKYLREYMRVTLYHDQIVAQEGAIKPLIDLSKE